MTRKSKKPLTIIAFAKMGNRARNKSLSPQQRKELARRAANTRWSKAKAEKRNDAENSQ